jgi:seryl-tRNA synthetase
MHDIKNIISDPDSFEKEMTRRGVPKIKQLVERLIRQNAQSRLLTITLEHYLHSKKQASAQIGIAMKEGYPASAAASKHRVKQISANIESIKADQAIVSNYLDDLKALPNIAADDVPDGKSSDDNVTVRFWKEPAEFDFTPLDHVDLGVRMGLLDFEQTVKIAGSRYSTLKGPLAKLERVLGQFMLSHHESNGMVEHAVPYIVNDQAMYGTGQFPKFHEDCFATSHGGFMIPTSEVSLTNLVRETILSADQLPIRMVALTPCFRAEAGSAGRDTRGIIRQHQFNKVEMVTIAHPDESENEHYRMLKSAEDILQLLGLPYRVMKLCVGDMGFSARKTYDLEVWLPSQNTYREISSISNCGDFQARRMSAKYKASKDTKPEFVHTLNGSGLAVGRTLVAVMENYQNMDGSITIPDALVPYMGGTCISAQGKVE